MWSTIRNVSTIKRFILIIALLCSLGGQAVFTSLGRSAAQSVSYEAEFTFIKYGVHRASSSLTIQPNGTAQLIVDQRHGYKINLSLMEKVEGSTINIKFALKDADRWVHAAEVTSKVRPGIIARYDLDISDAKIKDAKGKRIKKLSFGLKIKNSS